jgi:phage/plasmid-like protein (TIGR03299 family)
MSHFVETMAYVGKIPWHRLGTYVGEENVDGKTMLQAAGLDWQVGIRPVYWNAKGTGENAFDAFIEVAGQNTTIRLDRNESFDCTVGSRFTAFQNESLFEFGDAMLGLGGVKWHTAGSLLGGRKIWALAQVEGEIDVVRRSGKHDTAAPFILLYNSHDGSGAFVARNSLTRVVCWNTLTMSLAENQAEIRIPHTATIKQKAKEAADVLGRAAKGIVESTELLQGLADTPMSKVEFTTFAAQILTGEDDVEKALEIVAKSTDRSKGIFDRKGATLTDIFENGKGNEGDSLLDGLHAVTEYIDHQRSRIADWKSLDDRVVGKGLDSAAFGQGEKTKRRALRLLTKS